MASKLKPLGTIPISRVAWNPRVMNAIVRLDPHNPKRQEENLLSFAINGPLVDRGSVVIMDDESPIWNAHCEESLTEEYYRRKTTFDRLEASKKPEDKWELENCFVPVYCDSNNQVIKPDLLGVTWNGRSLIIYDAIVKRARGWKDRDGIEHEPQPIFTTLPYDYRVFKTEEERITAQFQENQKLDGQTPMTLRDNFSFAKYLREKTGASQKKLRDRFGPTLGQKFDALLKLDNMWNDQWKDLFPGESPRRNMNITSRCLLDPGSEGAINLKKLNQITQLNRLVYRSNPDWLREENIKIENRNDKRRAGELGGDGEEQLLSPLTADELEQYLTGKKTGDKDKIIGKKDWDNMRTNVAAPAFLQEIAKGHVTGNSEVFTQFVVNKDVCNEFFSKLKQGRGNDLMLAMRLMDLPGYTEAIKPLLQPTGSNGGPKRKEQLVS